MVNNSFDAPQSSPSSLLRAELSQPQELLRALWRRLSSFPSHVAGFREWTRGPGFVGSSLRWCALASWWFGNDGMEFGLQIYRFG
jgi:hypothetical protein